MKKKFGKIGKSKKSAQDQQQQQQQQQPASPLFGGMLQRDVKDVPMFVAESIAFLEKHALEEEGLFRVPGDNNVMKQTKQDLNEGKPFNVQEIGRNVNTVASLLKMYFRELPEPLLTYDHYDMFIAAEGVPDPDTRINCIKKVLQFIPTVNMKLLAMLCQFLHRVAQKEEVNKMSTQNLAIVFAPNLLKPDSTNPLDFAKDSAYSLGLMKTLIEQCDFMFDSDKMLETPQEMQRRRIMQRKEEEQQGRDQEETDILEQVVTNNGQNNGSSGDNNDEDDDSDFEFDVENAATPAEATERINRLSMRISSGKPVLPPQKPVPPPRKPSALAFAPPVPPPRNQMVRNATPISRKGSTVLPPPTRSNTGTSQYAHAIRKPPPPLPIRRSTVATVSSTTPPALPARIAPRPLPPRKLANKGGIKTHRNGNAPLGTSNNGSGSTGSAAELSNLAMRRPPLPMPARPSPPPLPSRQ